PQPAAVEEGAKVLMDGGNAIDAAITCAFVQAIVDPQMCGIGGYMLLNLHLAHPTSADLNPPQPIVLDAPALAGSKVTPTMWEDKVIRPNPDGWGWFLEGKINDVGYQSICTPGAVQGFAEALRRWGTISWQRALEPAMRLAEEGFVVSQNLSAGWKTKAKYPEASSLLETVQSNAEARRIYLKPDGSIYEPGEVLRNPDYARTLRQLAERGAEDFYQGELATRISADLAANGSFVTAEDLATYRLREEAPVVGTYRGYTIVSAPPPHGGPTLIAILNILEGYDLASLGHNSPAYIRLVAMAMKAAFADRNRTLGDPQFVNVPLDWMTSKDRAAEWRQAIDAGAPIDVGQAQVGPAHTTHVTVVDRHGNCVALTHSLGSSSGVIPPGLGFMFNNSMINFHPYAGHPNSIAPRKGRTTGMTPTIVFRDGKPILVLGAPGATRIITSCLQVILNVIDFGMSVSDAVLAPRFDCQGDVITCHARIPEFVCAQVRKHHPIQRLAQSHGGLALVHAIALDPQTGKLSGGADAGSGGMALEV
ncbi:MAG: gamma-glutamyltransferase, partial [Abditibacteriales bacterium]|nr:gamma-glutamyltransferase [Abditibacteriales bacterium]MDW8368147.1 gamma-glutamyltransferase [Abditibacteriales bacterium]